MEKKNIILGIREGVSRDIMKKSPSEQALAELFWGKNGGDKDISIAHFHHHPSLLLINQDVMHGLSSLNPLNDHVNFWSKKTTPSHAGIVGPGDAQSSTCDITKNTGATSGSSHELWEDDDMDAEEGGACEQSVVNNNDVKRTKRMASNRESARRSRRRKQE